MQPTEYPGEFDEDGVRAANELHHDLVAGGQALAAIAQDIVHRLYVMEWSAAQRGLATLDTASVKLRDMVLLMQSMIENMKVRVLTDRRTQYGDNSGDRIGRRG